MQKKRSYRYDVWGKKNVSSKPRHLTQHNSKAQAVQSANSFAKKGYFGIVYDRDEELGHFAPKGYSVRHKRVYPKRRK